MDVSAPAYAIHEYRPDIYKVVAFKRRAVPLRANRDEQKTNDRKLDNNFARARSMVLQYALCNPWEYFFTGTIDRAKFNRFDLDVYAAALMQWIRDKRKAYGAKFQVLLVPEHHKNGAWHIHGLVHDLPESVLCPFAPPAPEKLLKGNFLNWPDYMEKFGFCSLAPIRDPVACAFYISKYVSKELSQRAGEKGKHLYFHSRPLKRAQKAADVFEYVPELDRICINDFTFCRTGMVFNENWSFPYSWDNYDDLPTFGSVDPYGLMDSIKAFRPETIDPLYEQERFHECFGND